MKYESPKVNGVAKLVMAAQVLAVLASPAQADHNTLDTYIERPGTHNSLTKGTLEMDPKLSIYKQWVMSDNGLDGDLDDFRAYNKEGPVAFKGGKLNAVQANPKLEPGMYRRFDKRRNELALSHADNLARLINANKYEIVKVGVVIAKDDLHKYTVKDTTGDGQANEFIGQSYLENTDGKEVIRLQSRKLLNYINTVMHDFRKKRAASH